MLKHIRNILFLSLVLHTSFLVNAQEKIVTAGFQFKPIFSSAFFNTSAVNIAPNTINYSIAPQLGYCFGMVIRKGITSTISAETAINYVKRNYQLVITEGSFKGESYFSIIGYEIPLQALVFIRLSKNSYMDAAAGMSMDFFPSDIFTQDTAYFKHKGFKRSWILPSVIANIGWEYRTAKSGYFYVGSSYHKPFTNIYRSEITYDSNGKYEIATLKLSGNYLTIDFRYFFHANPLQNKKKK